LGRKADSQSELLASSPGLWQLQAPTNPTIIYFTSVSSRAATDLFPQQQPQLATRNLCSSLKKIHHRTIHLHRSHKSHRKSGTMKLPTIYNVQLVAIIATLGGAL
jgi:hypothetical protein